MRGHKKSTWGEVDCGSGAAMTRLVQAPRLRGDDFEFRHAGLEPASNLIFRPHRPGGARGGISGPWDRLRLGGRNDGDWRMREAALRLGGRNDGDSGVRGHGSEPRHAGLRAGILLWALAVIGLGGGRGNISGRWNRLRLGGRNDGDWRVREAALRLGGRNDAAVAPWDDFQKKTCRTQRRSRLNPAAARRGRRRRAAGRVAAARRGSCASRRGETGRGSS